MSIFGVNEYQNRIAHIVVDLWNFERNGAHSDEELKGIADALDAVGPIGWYDLSRIVAGYFQSALHELGPAGKTVTRDTADYVVKCVTAGVDAIKRGKDYSAVSAISDMVDQLGLRVLKKLKGVVPNGDKVRVAESRDMVLDQMILADSYIEEFAATHQQQTLASMNGPQRP